MNDSPQRLVYYSQNNIIMSENRIKQILTLIKIQLQYNNTQDQALFELYNAQFISGHELDMMAERLGILNKITF